MIKNKLDILELARQHGNISQACNVMGFLRDSFYRFKQLYDQGGELALADIKRKGKPQPKNRIDPDIEKKIWRLRWTIRLSDSREYPTNLEKKVCLFLPEV